MEERRADRKLAAILAADVAGYSRLMGADEEGTLARLNRLRREVVDPVIAGRKGRIVKTSGDGLLAEFPSVVEAVLCAAEIQERAEAAAASEPDDRRLSLRIGVNLGDVIAEGGDIFGDGVNVAARLEGMAEPGGVIVSAAVHEHVEEKTPLSFEDLGEQRLKNIARPVRVFRLVPAGAVRPAPTRRPALALPDKPSIAVLPFANLSGDADQDYFAEGIVGDIIAALWRAHWLFVISHSSSLAYKGRTVAVKDVGRELGVRYVLEGSVRKAGNRVRIAAQLVEAATGASLWADRFDGALDDIFDLQDRIAASVACAIEPSVRRAEIERARRKPTASLDAYDCYLRALAAHALMTREGNDEALALIDRAVTLDPGFARGHALGALARDYRFEQGWAADPEACAAEGVRAAHAAVAADRDDAEVLGQAAMAVAYLGCDLPTAMTWVTRSLALNANSVYACCAGILIHGYAGEADTALRLFERARRVSPLDPLTYALKAYAAIAHYVAGRYEAAAALCEDSLRDRPDVGSPLRVLAASLGQLGRTAEARRTVARLIHNEPGLTLATCRRRFMAFLPAYAERLVEGLRKAGMPE
jgi:adenylate cyclase